MERSLDVRNFVGIEERHVGTQMGNEAFDGILSRDSSYFPLCDAGELLDFLVDVSHFFVHSLFYELYCCFDFPL